MKSIIFFSILFFSSCAGQKRAPAMEKLHNVPYVIKELTIGVDEDILFKEEKKKKK